MCKFLLFSSPRTNLTAVCPDKLVISSLAFYLVIQNIVVYVFVLSFDSLKSVRIINRKLINFVLNNRFTKIWFCLNLLTKGKIDGCRFDLLGLVRMGRWCAIEMSSLTMLTSSLLSKYTTICGTPLYSRFCLLPFCLSS